MTAFAPIDRETATPLADGSPCLDWAPRAWPPARLSKDSRASGFDRVEWSIIILARHDGLASLKGPTRFQRIMSRVFGTGRTNKLAAARLEALRQLAVQAWHHGLSVPAEVVCATRAVGYSDEQIDELLYRIAKELCTSRVKKKTAKRAGCEQLRQLEALPLAA